MALPKSQLNSSAGSNLSHFAERLDLDLGIPEAQCQNIVVQKVEVYPQSARWVLHLQFSEVVEHWDNYWKVFSKEILKQYNCLEQVDFVGYYSCPKNNLDYFMLHHKDQFLEKIAKKVPSFAGWLWKIPMDVQNDKIIMKLPTNFGVQFILAKQIDILLSDILKEHFSLDAKFEFLVDQSLAVELPNISDELPQARLSLIKPQERSTTNVPKKDKANPCFGRQITASPIAITQLIDEEKRVVIQGKVIEQDVRELKTRRSLFTWDVSDGLDSVSVKVFAEDKDKNFLSIITKGSWVLVQGPVRHDRYTNELTLMAQDINLIEPVLRQDRAPLKRIEFHLHTKMSALDGLAEIDDIIRTAARWGHSAVAITDHGVVQAFPQAYELGKKYGVKIIYGVEGYLSIVKGDKTEYFHVSILAQNKQGLENLYRLISLSHLEYFYRRPRIPKDLLVEYREGLLIGTACESGELIQAYLKGGTDEELCQIASFYDYIEIMPSGNNEFLIEKGRFKNFADIEEMNRKLIWVGDQLEKPVIATGDVHFLEPEDEVYRRILQSGQGYDSEKQAPLYLRTTDEMMNEFGYLDQATAYQIVVENPNALNEQIDEIAPFPDGLFTPEISGADEDVRKMCYQEANRLYGKPLPSIVKERLDKELDSIISNGFAILYYIAHKLVKKSNEDGYLVGSRGSVGSSLVATFCGITEVNPLPPHYRCSCKFSEFIIDGSFSSGVDLPNKHCPRCNSSLHKDGHDIPFETFLGFEGDKVPDIDLNFSGDYQPKAHKYTEQLFGKEYVFRAGTIATIAEKTAFGFVKKYLEKKDSFKRNAEISRLVKGCSGVKRTTGQHPGGLMVVPKNLDIHQFTPIQRPADDMKSGTITTHFDYHSISDRLVKLDILGHDDPTIIKMLEDLTGVDAKAIPLDDPKTLTLFSGVEILNVTPEQIRSTVGTYGIPEFGTGFVRQMLEATKPQRFSELVRISGLSHGTDVWLNNAQDLIKNGTATLSETISTRDDIMVYLIYAGMPPEVSFKIMEDVRKGKGLKPEYEEMMKEHNIPNWYIESCKKIKYMFPKAHAVAYVTMAFRIAYFKVNYPLAFYASYFTIRANEFDAQLICQGYDSILAAIDAIERKGNEASARERSLMGILEVALEMMARGFAFYNVDLEHSDSTRFIIKDNGLLAPFVSLQGIGIRAAENLTNARTERYFTSIEDLSYRGKVSKTVVETLSNHGTLEGLPTTDQLSLF